MAAQLGDGPGISRTPAARLAVPAYFDGDPQCVCLLGVRWIPPCELHGFMQPVPHSIRMYDHMFRGLFKRAVFQKMMSSAKSGCGGSSSIALA